MTTASFAFSTDWFTPHIPAWTALFAPLRGQPDLHFLEVGSFEGRSACWLLEHVLTHPTCTLTCLDFFDIDIFTQAFVSGQVERLPAVFRLEERFDANIRAVGGQDRTIKIRGDAARSLRTLPLGHYHAVYIDGSHVAADVLRDAVLSWDLLRPDGLLIFDDYDLRMCADPLSNPQQGIDAFLSAYDGRYRLVSKGWQLVVRKGGPA